MAVHVSLLFHSHQVPKLRVFSAWDCWGLLVDEQNIVLNALRDPNDAAWHAILVAPHVDLLGGPVACRESEGGVQGMKARDVFL